MEHQQTQRDLQKTENQKAEQQTAQIQRQQSVDRTLLAQAILAGAEMGDLPRESLLELAQQVGNSGMNALAAMYGEPAETAVMPALKNSVEMQAFPVPADLICETVTPPVITGASWPSATFDASGVTG